MCYPHCPGESRCFFPQINGPFKTLCIREALGYLCMLPMISRSVDQRQRKVEREMLCVRVCTRVCMCGNLKGRDSETWIAVTVLPLVGDCWWIFSSGLRFFHHCNRRLDLMISKSCQRTHHVKAGCVCVYITLLKKIFILGMTPVALYIFLNVIEHYTALVIWDYDIVSTLNWQLVDPHLVLGFLEPTFLQHL